MLFCDKLSEVTCYLQEFMIGRGHVQWSKNQVHKPFERKDKEDEIFIRQGIHMDAALGPGALACVLCCLLFNAKLLDFFLTHRPYLLLHRSLMRLAWACIQSSMTSSRP